MTRSLPELPRCPAAALRPAGFAGPLSLAFEPPPLPPPLLPLLLPLLPLPLPPLLPLLLLPGLLVLLPLLPVLPVDFLPLPLAVDLEASAVALSPDLRSTAGSPGVASAAPWDSAPEAAALLPLPPPLDCISAGTCACRM